MTKVSSAAKYKILGYLSKTSGYNTLTVAKAQSMFGIKNVAARIDELRKEGHAIYTNSKNVNGEKGAHQHAKSLLLVLNTFANKVKKHLPNLNA